MKTISLSVLLLAVFCVNLCRSDDLQVGTSLGAQLAYFDSVKLSSIPFTTRTKNVFYNSDKNQVIKAISAIDVNKSKAKVTITAGGVGATFVNIKLKGERGEALNYQIQIFA